MSNAMQPVRTEYQGVVFDSKSEAVFARTLTLLGHRFIYHPGPHCGHEWDFLVFRKPDSVRNWEKSIRYGDEGKKIVLPLWSDWVFEERPPMLVEYKPSAPTDTYIDNLTNKMRVNPFESVIVWGNPWSGSQISGSLHSSLSYVSYPVFTTHDRFGWGDFNRDMDCGAIQPISVRHQFSDIFDCENEFLIQEAKSYRFDLADTHFANAALDLNRFAR